MRQTVDAGVGEPVFQVRAIFLPLEHLLETPGVVQLRPYNQLRPYYHLLRITGCGHCPDLILP